MPKIYKYLGIIFKFWSDDHEPIHLHAFYGAKQVKILIYIVNNKIVKIEYKTVKGYEKIPPAKMADVKEFVEKYEKQIVDAYIRIFILKMKWKCVVIKRRIK